MNKKIKLLLFIIKMFFSAYYKNFLIVNIYPLYVLHAWTIYNTPEIIYLLCLKFFNFNAVLFNYFQLFKNKN